MKKRSATFHFVLDGTILFLFVLVLSTGLMLKFVLPHGSGGAALLGQTRHEWGGIHFWLSMGLVGLMALHVLVHRRWVWAMAKGKQPERQKARLTAFVAATVVILAILAVPFLFPVSGQMAGGGERRGAELRLPPPPPEHGMDGRGQGQGRGRQLRALQEGEER
ncbi:MAG: hypothetical protein PWP23_1800 [Candidatus Sumerlaeota bacterium]|nr:hypothetical protein [Candidatus Sumerlaeota bacterium]